MINYRKQKRILLIPLLNVSILFIMVGKNAKYFVDYWQMKLLPYMLGAVLCCIPVLALQKVLDPYIQEWIKAVGFAWLPTLVFFYCLSILVMGALLLAQKRLIKEEYKELFYSEQ